MLHKVKFNLAVFLVFVSNSLIRGRVYVIFLAQLVHAGNRPFINRKAEALSFVLSICRWYFRASRFFHQTARARAAARVLGGRGGEYSARSVARFETN